MSEPRVDVAVVGAGPYGLSIAANFLATERSLRIFGRPMHTWTSAMPLGMMLKSDGFASNLSGPGGGLTLSSYCRDRGIPYSDSVDPVSLATFVAYGQEFQRHFVPRLETVDIQHVQRDGDGFKLTTEEGEQVLARGVVLAVGVTHFRVVPKELSSLDPSLATHSADHHRLDRFAGRKVAVIGAGSSAANLAAALIDAGAAATIVTRSRELGFDAAPVPGEKSLLAALRHPSSPLGPGWRSRLASDLPQLYRHLPAGLRLTVLHRHLGPRSAWYLRDKVIGRADILTDSRLVRAAPAADGVRLELVDTSGTSRSLDVDHVIAATGYWPQIARLRFLDEALRRSVRHVAGVPVLSHNFETSVPGLYAAGLAAAGSFGPLLRFVAGADFTARTICRHLQAARADGHAGLVERPAPQVA